MYLKVNFSSWKPWAVIAGALVVTSLGLGTTWSYLKTGHFLIGKTIRENVPIQFEIERLGQIIAEGRQNLRQDEQQVALVEVQCEQLKEEIEALEKSLQASAQEMAQLRDLLKSTSNTVAIGTKTYDREEVEAELNRRLDEYEVRKASLEEKRKRYEERNEYVKQQKRRLAEDWRTLEQLVLQQEALQDQKRLMDSQPVEGERAFDRNKIVQAKQLAEELNARLKAQQKVHEKYLAGGRRIELPKGGQSATERFDSLFGSDRDAKVTATQGP